ncbi:hypothetical protein [Rhodohalobacter barkolensis]|uniref:hypothetical protein n=1 Tax=Rhodohalobacter barkolensis TaxID=2053187 RepID=UPI000C34C40C|nr:hypothetical protein [Rhodohalobacter barkolensis]
MKIWVFIFLLVQSVSELDSDEHYADIYFQLNENTQNTNSSVTLHPDTGDLYIYYQNPGYLIRFTENSEVDTLATLEFESNFGQVLDVHPEDKNLLFWDSGVGRVHSFDLNERSLERLDESHNHMNQFGHAATLGEDGTIYAMGGYGYWTFKNLLIEYIHEEQQWELVSIPDPNLVPKNNLGLLLHHDDTFTYFTMPLDQTVGHNLVYTFKPAENRWEYNETVTSLLSQRTIDVERSASYYRQTSTQAVDREKHLFGFLNNASSQNDLAYILNYRDNEMYELDLSQFSIYDAKNIFYSSKQDRWVILGHPFSTNRRDHLIVKTIPFNPDHPAFTRIEAEQEFELVSMVILGGFGGLFVLLLGWLAYKTITTTEAGTSPHSKNVTISKNDNSEIEIYFEGERFNYSGDIYLTRFIEVIYDMKINGISEMLISDLDQKLFSENTHASYMSRTRKKLIQVINQESNINLIEERKSQTDKRVKVIYLNLDKIKIIP